MTAWSRIERADLVSTLHSVGPDAPTLCAGWKALELVSHLVIRENRIDAMPGIVFSRAAGHTQRVQRQFEERLGYEGLIQRFADGPPAWSPTRLASVGEAVNLSEHFIHHEDLRRAGEAWEPRGIAPRYQAALWARLRSTARLMLRRAAPIRLIAPGYGETLVTGKAPASSAPTELVTITAPPSELVLFCSGRQSHSSVDIAGEEPRVSQVREARLGL